MVGMIAILLTAFVAVRPKAFDAALKQVGIELPLARMECGDSSPLSWPLPMARITEELSARFPHEGKESGNQFPHSKIRKRCSARFELD